MELFTTKNYMKWEKERIKNDLKEKLKKLKTESAKNNAREKAIDKLKAIDTKKKELLEMAMPECIYITVEWVKSKTWGMNPHADVRIWNADTYESFTGSASGCGYDKLSASIAEAFNKSDILKAMLLKSIRKINAYILKATLGNIPAIRKDFSFQGGVGISSYQILFDLLGYKYRHSETRTSDYITIEK